MPSPQLLDIEFGIATGGFKGARQIYFLIGSSLEDVAA
jgi:hypothetical protein